MDQSFAIAVVGPPGSGKTTFCYAIRRLCRIISRPCAIVNLDAANENPHRRRRRRRRRRQSPGHSSAALGDRQEEEEEEEESSPGEEDFQWDVDIAELVRLEDVMQELGLGPNGAMMYCAELLKKNLRWLQVRLEALASPPSSASQEPVRFFILDLPGQVELYTHDRSVRDIMNTMQRKWGMRVCCVNLVDSTYCNDPATFISATLLSLATMVRMELPQVNVLSKMDILHRTSIDADGDPRGMNRPEEWQNHRPLRKRRENLEDRTRGSGRRGNGGEGEGGAEGEEEAGGEGTEAEGGAGGGGGREGQGSMCYNVDFYAQASELQHLVPFIGREGRPDISASSAVASSSHQIGRESQSWVRQRQDRHRRLHRTICEILEDYPLVSFARLDVTRPESVQEVVGVIDKALGYVSSEGERTARMAAETLGLGGP